MTSDDPAQDDIFVEQFLANEDKPDGLIIAARVAGFLSPMYPVRAMAEFHLNRPEIQLALKAARKSKKPLRQSGEPTPDGIYADCDYIIDKAISVNNFAAAVAGVKLKAQTAGLLKESVVHTHRLDVTSLSDDQLLAIVQKKPKLIEGTFTEVPTGLAALESAENHNG